MTKFVRTKEYQKDLDDLVQDIEDEYEAMPLVPDFNIVFNEKFKDLKYNLDYASTNALFEYLYTEDLHMHFTYFTYLQVPIATLLQVLWCEDLLTNSKEYNYNPDLTYYLHIVDEDEGFTVGTSHVLLSANIGYPFSARLLLLDKDVS